MSRVTHWTGTVWRPVPAGMPRKVEFGRHERDGLKFELWHKCKADGTPMMRRGAKVLVWLPVDEWTTARDGGGS